MIRRPFLGDASGLASLFAGNGIGQIIAICAVPVIARLCDATVLGKFGLFSATAATLAVISCACFDQAVVLARTVQERASIERVAAYSCFVFAALLQLIAIVCLHWPPLAGHLALGNILLALPAYVFMVGLFQVRVQAATQARRFPVLSRSLALRTGGTAVLQVLASAVLPTASMLVAAQFAALLIAHLFLGRRMGTVKVGWKDVKAAAERYRNCPLYLTPRLFLAALGDVAILGIAGSAFDVGLVGYFWMSQRLLQVPAGFIDAPVRQYYVAAAIEMRRHQGQFHRIFATTFGALMAIGCVGVLTVYSIGPWLIGTVLGAQWENSVPFLRVIIVGWVFEFASIPFAGTVMILNAQRSYFIFEVISRSLKLGGIIYAALVGDFLVGLALNSAVSIVCVVFYAGFLYRLAGKGGGGLAGHAVREPRAFASAETAS